MRVYRVWGFFKPYTAVAQHKVDITFGKGRAMGTRGRRHDRTASEYYLAGYYFCYSFQP